MLQKGTVDYFDLKGGINANDAEGNLADNEFIQLQNVELSSSNTLKKRKGTVQEGDLVSTNIVTHLDKYVTEDESTLLMSQDGYLYKLDSSTTNTSINLSSTLVAFSNYDATNRTIDMEVDDDIFLEEDVINFTIDDEIFDCYVQSVIGTNNFRLYGISSDLSSEEAGLVIIGSRVTDSLPVDSSASFLTNDMVTITGYNQTFKILSTESGIINVDEEIYITDGNTITISSVWTPFVEGTDSPKDEIFDRLNNGVRPLVSSSQFKNALLMTNGQNEQVFYDGNEISKLGFHKPKVPIEMFNEDPINNVLPFYVEAGGAIVDALERRFKITYEVTDNNGVLIESEPSEYVTYVDTGTTAGKILIPLCLPQKGFYNDELYNLDNISLNVYGTVGSGLDYYLIGNSPVLDFPIFNTTLTVSGSDLICDTSGKDADFYTRFNVGDYVYGRSARISTGINDKEFVAKVKSIDDVGETITLESIQSGDRNSTSITIVTDSTAVIYKTFIINYDDDDIDGNALLYSNKGIEDTNEQPPIAKYLTIWDNRPFVANCKSYPYLMLTFFGTSRPIGTNTFTFKQDTTETVFTTGESTDQNGLEYLSMLDTDLDMLSYLERLEVLFNSNPNCPVYCYLTKFGNEAGTLLFRQKVVDNNTLQFKINLNTSTYLDDIATRISINNTLLTSSDNNVYKDFLEDKYPSRVCWGKSNQLGSYVGVFGNSAIQSTFYEDVFPDNGQTITGIMPLATMLLIFKEDSCFRATKVGDDAYSIELLDANLGCVSPKSICSIGTKVIFMSRYGVRMTDGYFISYIGEKMQKVWDNIDTDYFSRICATHYVNNNQYWVSIPYKEDPEYITGTNNLTCVYDYRNNCWFEYTGFLPTMYTKKDNNLYFGTYNKGIYKVRSLGESNDYRDDASAIEAVIQTKWYDMKAKSSRKMFLDIITHIYQKLTNNNTSIEYSYDFKEDFKTLGNLESNISPWGYFSWGHSSWGSTITKAIKSFLSPTKAFYISLKYINNVKDEVLELLGITLEAKMLNNQAVPQTKE